MKFFILCLSLLLSIGLTAQNFIFSNGTEGYASYRIPAVVKAKSGKLLAFAEGRKSSSADNGDIDLVMKSSLDNGATWSALKKVWDSTTNTCGNPSPVIDNSTGNVIVVATLNNNRVVVLKSTDEGTNWQQPLDITNAVKLANWTWYASGPGHAIQYRLSSTKRRIIVACNHMLSGNPNHFAHTIYSDDKGSTWKLGGTVPTDRTDECTVAQLADGSLLLNMRNNDRTLPNRKISTSTNNGLTWSAAVYDSSLIDPICEGSLLRYSINNSMLLFTNPKDKITRKNLTMSVSKDNGKTWSNQVTIEPNESAYSDMVELSAGNVLVVYETGKVLPNIGIAAKIIPQSAIVIMP